MRISKAFLSLSACLPLFVLAACQPAETAKEEAPATATATVTTASTAAPAPVLLTATSTDADKIASAMRAAPQAIGNGATVMEMGADGAMRELRKGTNGFTCMPDNPATPGPDPMCGDANSMEFIHAMLTKATPPPGKVGVMYMLEGGTDASNTDPYAAGPTDTNNWIKTGPHLMVVGAAKSMAGYPRDPKPDTTKPYVMFPGTPYEHLMVPIG